MASPALFFPWEGNLWPSLLRKPSQKSNLLSCVTVFCQIPALNHSMPTVSMSSTTGLLCFISGQQLGLKTTNLKGPCNAGTLSPSGREHPSMAPYPRKAVLCLHECLESMGSTVKSSSLVICLPLVPLFPAVEWPLDGTWKDFCP